MSHQDTDVIHRCATGDGTTVVAHLVSRRCAPELPPGTAYIGVNDDIGCRVAPADRAGFIRRLVAAWGLSLEADEGGEVLVCEASGPGAALAHDAGEGAG